MYEVETESGAVYQFDGDKVRRVSDSPMRDEGRWLQLQEEPRHPVIGQPMVLWLEPLCKEAIATQRTTTPVVRIGTVGEH